MHVEMVHCAGTYILALCFTQCKSSTTDNRPPASEVSQRPAGPHPALWRGAVGSSFPCSRDHSVEARQVKKVGFQGDREKKQPKPKTQGAKDSGRRALTEYRHENSASVPCMSTLR